MATPQPDRTTAPSANIEERISLPNEAAPVAAVVEDASTTSATAASASQEKETAPVLTATTGPSTAVEYDPAPVQPPIQPVSTSNTYL